MQIRAKGWKENSIGWPGDVYLLPPPTTSDICAYFSAWDFHGICRGAPTETEKVLLQLYIYFTKWYLEFFFIKLMLLARFEELLLYMQYNDYLSDALMRHAPRGTERDLVRRDIRRASWLSHVGATPQRRGAGTWLGHCSMHWGWWFSSAGWTTTGAAVVVVVVAEGSKTNYYLLLLRKRSTFRDEGGSVHLILRLRAGAEPTKSNKAGNMVPDKQQARQPTHLYIIGVIWDPCRSLVDKRPVLEVISI